MTERRKDSRRAKKTRLGGDGGRQEGKCQVEKIEAERRNGIRVRIKKNNNKKDEREPSTERRKV